LIWQPDPSKTNAEVYESGNESSEPKPQTQEGNNDKYLSSALSGKVTFDYSNNNGDYLIGEHPYDFVTHWSKASDTSIHVYNDPPSIKGVGLAYGISQFNGIGDAKQIDMSSRTRTPQEGEFVVLANTRGYYAALRITDIKDRTRNDKIDQLSFEYVILPDGKSNFSEIKN
jgi:hypothetical protein